MHQQKEMFHREVYVNGFFLEYWLMSYSKSYENYLKKQKKKKSFFLHKMCEILKKFFSNIVFLELSDISDVTAIEKWKDHLDK